MLLLVLPRPADSDAARGVLRLLCRHSSYVIPCTGLRGGENRGNMVLRVCVCVLGDEERKEGWEETAIMSAGRSCC